MNSRDYYAFGDYNALCAQCGFKFKASELIKHWQGYYVCRRCWEPRHPQDFVKAVPESAPPPWVQPRPSLSYSAFCTPNGLSAVPGQAEPGCLTPGYLSPAYNSEGY